jgi:hypothetical protein
LFCENFGGVYVKYEGDITSENLSGECVCKNGNKKFDISKWPKSIISPITYSTLLNQDKIVKNVKSGKIFKDYSDPTLDKMMNGLTINDVLRMIKNEKRLGKQFKGEEKNRLLKNKEFQKSFIQQSIKKDLKYYDTFRGGEFNAFKNTLSPYGLEKIDSIKNKIKQNKIRKYKKEKFKWESRICSTAKKVCVNAGGYDVYQDEGGRWRCGCKNEVIITTDRPYFNAPKYNKIDVPDWLIWAPDGNQLGKNEWHVPIDKFYQIGDYGSSYTNASWKVREYVSDPQTLLLVGSVAASLLIPGVAGAVIGGLLDVADIAYSIYNKDAFGAGLGVIFMLLPMGKAIKLIGYKPSKEALKKIIKKINSSEDLLEEEAELVAKVTTKETLKEVLINYIKTKTYAFFKKNPSLAMIAYFVKNLLNLGFLTTKFLFKVVVVIGGVSITWYYILKLFGLIDKEEVKQKIKKQTSEVGVDINLLIEERFPILIKENKILSIRDINKFSEEVALLQFALIAGGYNVLKDPFEPTVEPWMKNFNGKPNPKYNVKYDYLYKPENNLLLQQKIRQTNQPMGRQLESPKRVVIKRYGYYDEGTKIMVDNFQRKNNITPYDGDAGQKTISKILDFVKNDKFGTIKNYGSLKFKEVDIKVLDTPTVDVKVIERKIQQDPDKVRDSITQESDQIINIWSTEILIEKIKSDTTETYK